jgi:hypothetical protein
MQWLLALGKDWVGISAIYGTFKDIEADEISFWDVLEKWHNHAHITKRHNTWNYENSQKRRVQGLAHITVNIEQYKLTKKALTLLGERTTDE